MALYIAPEQTVELNTPVTFIASIPCNKGYVYHEDGTGNFILKGIVNNACCGFARYNVRCVGNVAVTEGGTAAPIALAISQNGEPIQMSRGIYTPAAAEDYGCVVAEWTIDVPKGCCFNVAARYVSGVTDGTTTPPATIDVLNTKMEITRTA